MSDDDEKAIWIKTEPSVDGSTYVVSLELGDDRAVVMTPERAMAHASVILAAAQRAEYDAAVVTQMRDKVPLEAIGQLVGDLRKDRPPLDGEAIAPMEVEPAVSAKAHPFLVVSIAGEEWGQWAVPAARAHAMNLLEAVQAADLDAAYYRALTGLVGLEEGTARQVIEDLANHRQEVA